MLSILTLGQSVSLVYLMITGIRKSRFRFVSKRRNLFVPFGVLFQRCQHDILSISVTLIFLVVSTIGSCLHQRGDVLRSDDKSTLIDDQQQQQQQQPPHQGHAADEDVATEAAKAASLINAGDDSNLSSTPLVLNGISKEFGTSKKRFRAVDNLSLLVGEDEIFGLLGPNGAGKSTTMDIITGLLIPSLGFKRANDIRSCVMKTKSSCLYEIWSGILKYVSPLLV